MCFVVQNNTIKGLFLCIGKMLPYVLYKILWFINSQLITPKSVYLFPFFNSIYLIPFEIILAGMATSTAICRHQRTATAATPACSAPNLAATDCSTWTTTTTYSSRCAYTRATPTNGSAAESSIRCASSEATKSSHAKTTAATASRFGAKTRSST